MNFGKKLDKMAESDKKKTNSSYKSLVLKVELILGLSVWVYGPNAILGLGGGNRIKIGP